MPAHITEEIYTKEGLYTVLIDADVKNPEQTAYSVYSIAPDDFTQEEVDRAIAYLFDDKPLYAEDYTLTKDMIMQKIVQIKAEMQTMEEGSDDLEAAIYALNKLEGQYDSAPETVESRETTSELKYDPELGCTALRANADLGIYGLFKYSCR